MPKLTAFTPIEILARAKLIRCKTAYLPKGGGVKTEHHIEFATFLEREGEHILAGPDAQQAFADCIKFAKLLESAGLTSYEDLEAFIMRHRHERDTARREAARERNSRWL